MSKAFKLILCLIIPVIGFAFYAKDHYFYEAGSQVNFEPFFKTDSSGPEYMPLLPELTNFDIGMLKVCGDWGAHPDKEDFKILLDCPKHQKTVQEIYDKLDHQVITPNASLELFKDELAKIWFTPITPKSEKSYRTGFRHVFCGEPSGKLGGMHFVGRYVEAQENQWAGAIWEKSSCDQLDIKPPVYTFGVNYLDENKEIKTKCPGGYAYNLHADDIIVFATQAFKELGKQGGCLYKMEHDGYDSVFFRTQDGISTFYPDLTSECNDKSINCSCDESQPK